MMMAMARCIGSIMAGGGSALASTDLPSLTSSLPVGPIPSTVAAAAPGGGGSTFSITIDRIEITALDGDAEEIGASISEAVGRHMRAHGGTDGHPRSGLTVNSPG